MIPLGFGGHLFLLHKHWRWHKKPQHKCLCFREGVILNMFGRWFCCVDTDQLERKSLIKVGFMICCIYALACSSLLNLHFSGNWCLDVAKKVLTIFCFYIYFISCGWFIRNSGFCDWCCEFCSSCSFEIGIYFIVLWC